MAAPRDIVDAWECVLSIYFSGVRHNLRAAFILCDEAVEITLRSNVKQSIPTLGRMNFHQLLRSANPCLDPNSHSLGGRLAATHQTRNDMQHSNAAAAVDVQHCADAILDGFDCVEHCFPGARSGFPDAIKLASRIVQIYSTNGNTAHRDAFEAAMLKHPWRGQSKPPSTNEIVVGPGRRRYWGLVVMSEFAAIDTILTRILNPRP
jgi:hypothetical protein